MNSLPATASGHDGANMKGRGGHSKLVQAARDARVTAGVPSYLFGHFLKLGALR